MANAARLPNAAALVAIGAVAVTTAALSLITLSRLKDWTILASLNGRPVTAAGLWGTIGPADVVLAVLAGAAVLALAWLEWRHRACTTLLATMTGTEAWVLLTILVAWFGHAYLGSGVPLGGDTGTHVSRFLEVARGLDAGVLPTWTNYQYAGAPLLWFTGPLTYVVGGGIATLVRDAVLATKILLFGLHMLSGWLYFGFLRRLAIRALPAAVVASGFAGSFAHLHLFLFRGVIPQGLTIVFLVMLFYAADGLMRGRGARWINAPLFALATAGLIVNHQPHALFAAVYLALFGGVALLQGFWRWRGLPILALFGLLGVVASAIAVFPVMVEADWVMIEPEGGLFGFHLPTVQRMVNLVRWRNVRTTWGIDYWAYLGLGFVVFGAAGVVGLVRKQLNPGAAGAALPACACLALGLVLFNPVVRDIVFILFFVGVLAALGLDWLLTTPLLAGRRLLVVVMVAIADLASTSIQPVFRNDKGFLVDAGKMLERTAPNQRLVQLTMLPDGGLDPDMGPDGGPISYYSTVQRIAGNHNMAATRMHNFLAATADQVATDLRTSGELSADTRAMLTLFNVWRVVCSSSTANGCPSHFKQAVSDPVLGLYLANMGAPALFSQRLIAMPPPADLEKPMLWPADFESEAAQPRIAALRSALHEIVSLERMTPGSAFVSAIAVQDVVPPPSSPAPDAAWHADIRDYAVTLDRVLLQVETSAPGWVQLAHPWFPSTIVTVNGVPTLPLRGMLDLMVVKVGTGVSTIILHDGFTPARRASAWASLIGLVLIGGASMQLAWKDRQRSVVAQ